MERITDLEHKIVNNQVCCIGHFCDLHYYTVEEYNKLMSVAFK